MHYGKISNFTTICFASFSEKPQQILNTQTNGPHTGEGTVTALKQSLFRLQQTMASVSLINFTWHLKDMWIQKKLLFFNHIPWRPEKFGSVILRAGTIFSCVGDVWWCCTTNSRAEIWLMTKALNAVKQKILIMSALQTNLCLHSISVHSCHRAPEAPLHYSKHRLKHLSGIKGAL